MDSRHALVGHQVEMQYNDGSRAGRGLCLAYAEHPSVLVLDGSGTRVMWPAVRTELVDPTPVSADALEKLRAAIHPSPAGNANSAARAIIEFLGEIDQ